MEQKKYVHTRKSPPPPSQKTEVSNKGIISFVHGPITGLEINYSYVRLKFSEYEFFNFLS